MSEERSLLDTVFAARIERAASEALGHCALADLRVLTGGHSGVTHLGELIGDDGPLRTVIKSTPPGRPAKGRHDVLRQARIVAALSRHGDVPVPAVLFTDSDEPPFFGGEFVAGVATDPIIGEPRPDETAAAVAASWSAAIELLARLHAVPLEAVGLTAESPRAPAAEVAIWADTARAAGMADDPRVVRLREELARRAPEPWTNAIVHGDFRLGNLIMDGATPRALIDWEIWSVGDPAVDLGWLVQFTDPGNYPGVGREVAGTPTAAEVVDAYCAAAGRPRETVDWFLALGCFKLAAIQAHNRKRHREGSHRDEWQERLGPSIDRLLERGADLLSTTRSD